MDNEKIKEFIKKIRIDNNLTQKDLADKYGVTYQAVSKWENGKNLPDITLLVQIAKDYDVDLSDILNIKQEEKTSKKRLVIPIICVSIIIGIILIFLLTRNKTFELKTITSSCKDFEVFGSLVYDQVKSSIYISNINYCGTESDINYQELSCSLFEKNNDTIKEISTCDTKSNITLSEYLKDVDFKIDNFSKKCKTYTKDSLYLEINAKGEGENIKTYKIPLTVDSKCDN
ncbi:MAG: helix-turn-helix transcriptional regulator [Bacilli bacterium]|nr:helix-turn-helix transcriptional regulator [Bacilli bacterium]